MPKLRVVADGEPAEGWGRPGNAKRTHYFVGAKSMCRSWTYTGALTGELASGGSPPACATCSRLFSLTGKYMAAHPVMTRDERRLAQEAHRLLSQDEGGAFWSAVSAFEWAGMPGERALALFPWLNEHDNTTRKGRNDTLRAISKALGLAP